MILIRRCAWCGKTQGLKWSRKWWPPVGVTHGICLKCEIMELIKERSEFGD